MERPRRPSSSRRRAVREVVVDVDVEDGDAVRGQEAPPRALQRRVVVGVEAIEAEHAVAAREEGEGVVRADEPRGAGDEDGGALVATRGGAAPGLALPRRRGQVEQAVVHGPARGGGGRGEAEGVGDEGGVVHGEEGDEHERGEHSAAEQQVRRRGDEVLLFGEEDARGGS
jgi:hypothetical protein